MAGSPSAHTYYGSTTSKYMVMLDHDLTQKSARY